MDTHDYSERSKMLPLPFKYCRRCSRILRPSRFDTAPANGLTKSCDECLGNATPDPDQGNRSVHFNHPQGLVPSVSGVGGDPASGHSQPRVFGDLNRGEDGDLGDLNLQFHETLILSHQAGASSHTTPMAEPVGQAPATASGTRPNERVPSTLERPVPPNDCQPLPDCRPASARVRTALPNGRHPLPDSRPWSY